MPAKNRITINLSDAEYQTLVELSQKYDVSLAWLGRRALCDLVEQYRQTDEAQLPIPFLRKRRGERDQ